MVSPPDKNRVRPSSPQDGVLERAFANADLLYPRDEQDQWREIYRRLIRAQQIPEDADINLHPQIPEDADINLQPQGPE